MVTFRSDISKKNYHSRKGVNLLTYRTEKDSLGEKLVPLEAYYGIQTLRAIENFPISGTPIHNEIVSALAEIKKAAAVANMKTRMLNTKIGNNLIKAADEIKSGKFNDQFLVDAIQGGAGTSINMNMNEVLANLALEYMGKEKGDYFHCSPNNHVNMSQSTNDTVPTAIKIAAYKLTIELVNNLSSLIDGFEKKAHEFDAVIKLGRTHLQDAVPIRLGQEFNAYCEVLRRDKERILFASKGLLAINLGATAVGTGLNANLDYIETVTTELIDQVNIPLYTAHNLVDSTQNTDSYTSLSANLKVFSLNLSKICNDIRLMASGPNAGLNELSLPPRQPGSSIMPGKVNPVVVEVVNQTAFQVIGNDQTISMASEAGQFELNVMVPVLAHNLLQSLKILKNAIDVFHRYVVINMKANIEMCNEYIENSYGVITALNPHLGYEKAASIVKEAIKTNQTIIEVCEEWGLFTNGELKDILDPIEMTTPGISGSRFLVKN